MCRWRLGVAQAQLAIIVCSVTLLIACSSDLAPESSESASSASTSTNEPVVPMRFEWDRSQVTGGEGADGTIEILRNGCVEFTDERSGATSGVAFADSMLAELIFDDDPPVLRTHDLEGNLIDIPSGSKVTTGNSSTRSQALNLVEESELDRCPHSEYTLVYVAIIPPSLTLG